jgi:TrkA-N domain
MRGSCGCCLAIVASPLAAWRPFGWHDPPQCPIVIETNGRPVIFGDATLRQTLESASIDRARAVAVLTQDDMVNIEIGIVLREMLGPRVWPEVNRWLDVPLVLRVYDVRSATRWRSGSISKTFGRRSNWPHRGSSAPQWAFRCWERFRSDRAPSWLAQCMWRPEANSMGCRCSKCPLKPASLLSRGGTNRSSCTHAATLGSEPATPSTWSARTGNYWTRFARDTLPLRETSARAKRRLAEQRGEEGHKLRNAEKYGEVVMPQSMSGMIGAKNQRIRTSASWTTDQHSG